MSGGQLQQAWQLFDLGRYEQALTYATRARGAGADPAASFQLMSLSLTNLERFDAAIEAARDALREGPEQAFSHHTIGYAFFRKAIATRPTTNALLREGTVYDSLLQNAERAYRQALRIEPSDPFYHEMLGFVLFETDDYAGAEQSVRSGLQLDPNRPESFSLLSDICRMTRRYEEAHQHALKALAVSADRAGSHASLGWARLMHGDAASSLELFEEAMRLDPNDEYGRLGMIEALKVQNPLIRLPYRTLNRMVDLFDSKRWQWLGIGLWIGTALLLCLLVLIFQGDPGQATAALIVGFFIGLCLFFAVRFLPYFSWYLLTLCNVVLLTHPLGRQALTASQRCCAVAFLAYPLPVVVAIVLVGLSMQLGKPAWMQALATAVIASTLLAAPASLWGAALTTRWAYPAGIIALACVAVFALALLGLPPFDALRQTPVPQLALAGGLLGCVILPSRL